MMAMPLHFVFSAVARLTYRGDAYRTRSKSGISMLGDMRLPSSIMLISNRNNASAEDDGESK